ncbi:hypothetical protein [Sphingomonas sp. ACRSK]|uniref:hypothetical protein n=1 Tax=Sphingomonas sp. ACRSK TaxID=2918213 RepID=UPI001EF6A7B8|nr:hypothetical protein [Sphingomonas sp. ACRSK]MCG7349288.1 hypothetical protein [Sphingomonas sp. ACRSK]
MAKITALDVAEQLSGEELLPIVQGASTKCATMAAFRDLITPFLQYWYKGDRGDTGPAGNTYTSYAAMQASDPTRKSARLVGDTDVPPHPDGPYSNPTGTIGGWVAQRTDGVIFKRPAPTAVAQTASATLAAYAVTAEQFGAIGDGVADDAPAIQRAINHIVDTATATPGQTRPGVVLLAPGKWYKCGSALVINASCVSMTGYATLDFSSWTGTYITVTGRLTEFGNGYGRHGCFEGAIAIVGSGAGNAAGIGVMLENTVASGNARTRLVGLSITKCGFGVWYGARAYNTLLFNCQIFDCGTCVHWPGDTPDADERNFLLACDLYNSNLAIKHSRPAGNLFLSACSIDYVNRVWDLTNGKISAGTCHFEASNWNDRPFNTNAGDARAIIDGGWIVQQHNYGNATNLFYVGASAAVKLRDVLTNNTHNLATPNDTTPTTWATGPGRFEMTGTEPAFEFGGFPARQHNSANRLSDGEFERLKVDENGQVTGSEDLIWIRADQGGITSRYAAENLKLERSTVNQYDGAACLRINKQYGSYSSGQVVVACIPVRYGDKVTAGIRVRTAPDRPGYDQRLVMRGEFVKIDGYTTANRPNIVRSQSPGEITITPPTDKYRLQTFYGPASQIVVPPWATHFLMNVDTVFANQASFLVDGAWIDIG